MKAITAYALSKKYTNETAEEFGGLKGASCQIQSIEPIEGGQRITFLWVNSDGDERTSTLDLLNGPQGDPGERGEKGDTGFPPQITIESETESTYKLKLTYEDSETGEMVSIITPNLKGSGSGGDEELTPEQVANLISLL